MNIIQKNGEQEKLPIGTIRKAILGAAEEIAEGESFDKPKDRHYNQALSLLQDLKHMDAAAARKMILLAADGKNLKDKIGSEKYIGYKQVMADLTYNMKKELAEVFKKHFSNIDTDDSDTFIEDTIKKYIDDKLMNFKNHDPRFIEIFNGDENLFNDIRKIIAEGIELAQDVT